MPSSIKSLLHSNKVQFENLETLKAEQEKRRIEADLDEERLFYEDNLAEFFRAAWPYIDPAPWKDGWAIDAICEHLQAVIDGDIRFLMINQPPRTSKSSLVSVTLPAFCWAQRYRGPTSGPQTPFLYASYATRLSLRDSVKCRRLIQSAWYQRLWGERFQLVGDQNAKERYSNTERGERLITSISSGVTGEGGQIIVVDDANAANEADSEATIEATNDWWDQTMSTRLNDPETGAYIVVQQRLAENDLTGHILETSGDDWVHLMLPMRYEADRSFSTLIGWKDPRQEEGELLWPARFSETSVKALERRLGPYGAAGQLQQRPEPKGGGIIKREWWQPWPGSKYPPFDFILGSLDTAYTEDKENDPSAMSIWGVFNTDFGAIATRWIDADGRPQYEGRSVVEYSPKVMLIYAWRERLEFHALVTEVARVCKLFNVDRLVIENKAAGISTSQELVRLLGGGAFGIELSDPGRLDKQSRLYSVQHLFSEGLVYAPELAWSEMLITEVSQFPKGRYRDLTDTTSQALKRLRDMGLLTRNQERSEDIERSRRLTPTPKPLYPC